MKFFSKYNMINLALYAVFGVILAINGVSVVDKPLAFLSLLGILMVVDLLSYRKGLNTGGDIVKEVWDIK